MVEELLKVQKLSEDFVWFSVCWWHVIHFFGGFYFPLLYPETLRNSSNK